MRSIKIYSELLIKRHAQSLDGEALKFMSFLRNGATRMESLVRDLLTYTQATSFGEPPKVTDANEALKTALANLSGAIEENGAQVTNGPLPSLPVNGTHLQQLFQNLIGNALKYRSPKRPPGVHIEAEQQNENWVFSVADNGIGIDPQYKESIFGLFKRLHSSNEYSGTGIGLAICQRIVDRYHGRIWVESEPGRGSTSASRSPSDKASGGIHFHVLIVDDNESDLFLIEEAIGATRLPLTLYVAKDGEQAIRFFDGPTLTPICRVPP